jgi:hypothetical protein
MLFTSDERRYMRGLTVAAASWMLEARATSVERDWVFILEEEKQKQFSSKVRDLLLSFRFLQGRCAWRG